MQVAILVYPGMTALDAIGPYEVLNTIKEFKISFVWKEVGPIVTDSGALVLGATHSFAEIPSPDIFLVPGSSADTTTMMADDDVLNWLRRAHTHTRYSTSVCSGALILASAGILAGHPATTHWAGIPMLKQFGAEARPQERVVQSGKIITAAGVSAGIDMALHLVNEIYGKERAQVAQLLIEYDPHPPFDTGHMSKAPEEIRKKATIEMLKAGANPRDLISLPKVLVRQWRLKLEGLRSKR